MHALSCCLPTTVLHGQRLALRGDTVQVRARSMPGPMNAAKAVSMLALPCKPDMVLLHALRRRQADHARRLAKEAQERQQGPSAQAQQSAAEQLAMLRDVGDQGEGLCTVCFEQRSDMVFTGCGHLCTCQRCSRNLDRCPICRNASNTVRVYQI